MLQIKPVSFSSRPRANFETAQRPDELNGIFSSHK